jgi:hypothetical protein
MIGLGIVLFLMLVNSSLSDAKECPETRMVNRSEWEWDQYDKKVLDSLKGRCSKEYSDAKCLKLLNKYGMQDYAVICGSTEYGEVDKLYANAPKENQVKWIKGRKRKH